MNPTPKRDTHPLAINILKLQRYNFDFFSCEEVVLFEYMMVKGMSFQVLGEFYHSSARIQSETGIRRYALETILKRFVELGILDIEVKGVPPVKYFKVHFARVLELVDRIYQKEPGGMLPCDLAVHLLDFFEPLKEYQATMQERQQHFLQMQTINPVQAQHNQPAVAAAVY